jgi:hypothetical protein
VLAGATPVLVHNKGCDDDEDGGDWTPNKEYSHKEVKGRHDANEEYYSVNPETHDLVSEYLNNPSMPPREKPDGSVDKFTGNDLSKQQKRFWGSWEDSPIYWNGKPGNQIRIMVNPNTGEIAYFPLTKQGVHNYASPKIYKWR